MLTHMYTIGISAFSTLYVKLFIHSTLVRTQSLNIRIYFDRKTIIFIAIYISNKNQFHLKDGVIYKSVTDDKQLLV